MIIDNADDLEVLHRLPVVEFAESIVLGAPHSSSFLEYIPKCKRGRVVFVSRERTTAERFVDPHAIVTMPHMSEEQAADLVPRKLYIPSSPDDCVELAHTLYFFLLAIAQASAYIRHSRPGISVGKYMAEFCAVRKAESSLPGPRSRQESGLGCDGNASNAVFLTSQMSFKLLRTTNPSAAELLALMSTCDSQNFPEELLLGREAQSMAA